MSKLGARLRELRGELSLFDLEKATGINRSNIRKYEQGILLPTPEKLEKLSTFLEASYEELRFLWFDEVYSDPKEKHLILKWAELRTSELIDDFVSMPEAK